jgi:peptidoglycan/LPS O-acetylase OafA/YrhL
MRKLRKIPAFDGFRGISVLIVLLTHLPMITGATLYNAIWQINQTTRFGYICLDIFFSISGFFISRILLAEREATGRISFWVFYERRALRIFPVYYLTVFVCFLIFPMTTAAQVSLLSYTFNIYHPLTGAPNPMEHTWSLSVEEQFYFAWPFLMAFLPMRWLPTLTSRVLPVIAILSGLTISWLVVSDDKGVSGNLVYMLPLTRMLSLSFGGWLAVREMQAKPFRGWICLALVVAATGLLFFDFFLKHTGIVVSQGFYWTFALACYGMISLAVSATLIFDEGWFAQGLRRFLEFTPFRKMGKLSYAFYVFHLPVLYYFRINDAALPDRIAPALVVIEVVAIVLVLALASQRFIEAPLMALRSRRPAGVVVAAK